MEHFTDDKPATVDWNKEKASAEETEQTKQRIAKMKEGMGIPAQPVVDARPGEPATVGWSKETASEKESVQMKEKIAEIKKKEEAPMEQEKQKKEEKGVWGRFKKFFSFLGK